MGNKQGRIKKIFEENYEILSTVDEFAYTIFSTRKNCRYEIDGYELMVYNEKLYVRNKNHSYYLEKDMKKVRKQFIKSMVSVGTFVLEMKLKDGKIEINFHQNKVCRFYPDGYRDFDDEDCYFC